MDTQNIKDLQAILTGVIAWPGDAAYTAGSKTFEGSVTPRLVARPETSEDIAAILRFTAQHEVPVAIRSGGHGTIAGRVTDDMLLIDLSHFNTIEMLDDTEGLVRIGAGARWYDVARELQKYGRAISSGDTRSVGVGGLTTGGGLGWMVRKYGPAVDSVVAAEVVLADGTVVKASQDEHADLFWAVRGGGSNFGIVTYFTFRAHSVAGVFVGTATYPLVDVERVLRGWRDAMRQAPAELTTTLTILPPMGDTPASIMITGCFIGADKHAAEQAYAPLLNLGKATRHEIIAKPYSDILEDAVFPAGARVVVHNGYLKELSDEAISAIGQLYVTASPFLQVRYVAGAMNHQAADTTAFSYRDSEVLVVNPNFVLPPAGNKEIAAATAPWQKIAPFSQGVYLNLLSEDTGKELAQAFPPTTLERLREIKTQYDPRNIFISNYNIAPIQSEA